MKDNRNVLIAACILAAAQPVPAATSSTTMAVSAVTLASCAVTALPLVFGSINQIAGGSSDSQTTVVVTCTPGISYAIGLDQGSHASAGVRRMQAVLGSDYLSYRIYSNAARTTEWGNTVGTDTVGATAGLLPATYTVYGRIPSDAGLVAAGAYADLVTVTVTF